MQKEITNYINLKTKLAIAKSGVDPRLLPRDQIDDFMGQHSIFFADLEMRLIDRLEEEDQSKPLKRSKMVTLEEID